MILRVVFYTIAGYLAGSILFAPLAAALLGKGNIAENSADKNPGTTNAFRNGGFFCGLLAAGFTDLGVGEHIDLIITGAIMAQAPGLVITNFMRDVMAGDMMSGLVKLAEALLTGAGIALGTGVALSLVNAVWGVL